MKFTKLALTTAAVASAILVPSAANAAIETHHDPRGDVLTHYTNLQNFNEELGRAPGRTESDIAWIRTNTSTTRVRLRVHFHELRRTGDAKVFRFGVQGSEGSVVSGGFVAGRIDNDGNQMPWSGVPTPAVHPAVNWVIDYETNDFIVTMPREILGETRWVRSAFRLETVGDEGKSVRRWYDDARSGYTRKVPGYGSGHGTYGPRVPF